MNHIQESLQAPEKPLLIAGESVHRNVLSEFGTSGSCPIFEDGVTAAEHYINPVPAGLVLTGIVVSVSVTAFLLALVVRLYLRYHTLEMDEIVALSREEADE